jgi:hypothetical protein
MLKSLKQAKGQYLAIIRQAIITLKKAIYSGVSRVCTPPPPLLARTLQGMKNAQLESRGSENTYILARYRGGGVQTLDTPLYNKR